MWIIIVSYEYLMTIVTYVYQRFTSLATKLMPSRISCTLKVSTIFYLLYSLVGKIVDSKARKKRLALARLELILKLRVIQRWDIICIVPLFDIAETGVKSCIGRGVSMIHMLIRNIMCVQITRCLGVIAKYSCAENLNWHLNSPICWQTMLSHFTCVIHATNSTTWVLL